MGISTCGGEYWNPSDTQAGGETEVALLWVTEAAQDSTSVCRFSDVKDENTGVKSSDCVCEQVDAPRGFTLKCDRMNFLLLTSETRKNKKKNYYEAAAGF